MRDQARGKAQRKMLDHVLHDINSGQSLSKSFGKFPKVFSDFTVSIVRIGESSGTLSGSLGYLSDELKKRQMLRRKLVGAFIYPGVITMATLGITRFSCCISFRRSCRSSPRFTPSFRSPHGS